MERVLRTVSLLGALIVGTAALAQYGVYYPYTPVPYLNAPLYYNYTPVYQTNTIVAPFTGQTAYVQMSAYGSNVVLNGKPGPMAYAISNLTFSPNGARFAYLAQSGPGGPWFAVVDGLFGPQYATITNLLFSPSGNRFSYMAQSGLGGPWVIVVDGVVSIPYATITNLVFSPNEARVGYLAQGVPGGSWFAVIDGTVGPPYTTVSKLTFTNDSLHFFYNAWSPVTGQWLTIVDNIASTPMSGGGSPASFIVDPLTGMVVPASSYTPFGTPQTPKTADQVILGL
jgi:hypothetical protein